MARLGGNGEWLMQQIGGQVILFKEHTEEEIIRFNPADSSSVYAAQQAIEAAEQLSENEKASAHFWSGYFYAHAH